MTAPVLSQTPLVLASWFCPFAQRTLIALHAKKSNYEFVIHEVSHDELYAKPPWFLELNPAGLIPVIAWQQQQQQEEQEEAGCGRNAATAAACAIPGVVSITESLVCNEFLEDACPSPALLPPAPVARASARKIISRFDSKFVPAFYRLLVQQDLTVQVAAAATITQELTWLLQMMSAAGPLAVWPDRVSLVDCAVAPFLMRLYILEHYRGYTYHGPMADRLEQYLLAVKQHPAVAATCYHPTPDAHYQAELLKSYARYADGSANSLMARNAKENK